MENDNKSAFGPSHYLYGEAQALSLSIAAVRKAMGKANPADFPTNSPEWKRSMEEFVQDLWWALDAH